MPRCRQASLKQFTRDDSSLSGVATADSSPGALDASFNPRSRLPADRTHAAVLRRTPNSWSLRSRAQAATTAEGRIYRQPPNPLDLGRAHYHPVLEARAALRPLCVRDSLVPVVRE